MTPEIKHRITQIQQGKVPEGYKKGKLGIVPNEWEAVAFSTLFTSTCDFTDDLTSYPLYSLTIENGITAKTERYERSHLVKKENSYKVVRPDDYAYNPMNIRFGAVARHKGNIPVAVSGYYDIFTTIHKSDLDFMDSFLTCAPMITYYNKISTGSLIEKQRVHFSDFMAFSLELPPLEERRRIAEILTTQDKVIALQEQKIEELKKFKKVCLCKMFPKNGRVVPEVRFPGFTDAWEQRKLGEIATEIKRNDPESQAPIMMITAENGFIEQSKRYAFNNAGESLKKYILLQKGELAYNHGASKIRPFGSCFSLTTVESARIPFVYHCFSVRENNSEFVSIELNGKEVENQLRQIVSSGARMDGLLNISYDEYCGITLRLPETTEQCKISEFFRHLDHLITLHQRKLEEMKKQKKALMQLLLTGIVRVNV